MPLRSRPTALLVDLDGVLRTWDPAVPARVEASYGLPAGALLDTAMQWSRLRPAIIGEITDAEWMAAVAAALSPMIKASLKSLELHEGRLDHGGAAGVVAEWQAYRGAVDPVVLGFVREVRAAGIPVAIGTNATDRLEADLDALGLTGEVDAIVNSWRVKAHKPTKEFFAAACRFLGVPPNRVLLVDDSDRMVRGARVAGVAAYRWTGPDDLPYLRRALLSATP
jgi:putative hydrolase of the HAD superfamily